MSSDRYDYINLEAINDIADGDSEFVREIIGNYHSTVSDSIRNLNGAINECSTDRIVFFAHKLKGSFGFVGAEALQQIAMDVEANPSEMESIKKKLSEMIAGAGKVEAELKLYLQDLDR